MKSPSNVRILTEKEAFEKLKAIGEEGLFGHWNKLDAGQKENLLRQITHLNVVFFHRQQEELTHPQEHLETYEPIDHSFSSGQREEASRGLEALKKGKGACIVLAGGQGSRLRCEGPKGCFPITNIQKKTLFQLVAEKIKAASKQAGYPLQVAIMTSPLNHVETEFYFVQNAFFGLDPRQVTFFYQRMWPLLDLEGHLFLEAPDQIARGPNGNGGVFRRLVEIGLWKKWQERGVEMVSVLPIDNPLADPFDHELFGIQDRSQSDVVIKSSPRLHPEEKVGVLVKVGEKPGVLEYSELTAEQKNVKSSALANLGLYTFSMPFIQRAAQSLLPLHRAKKAAKHLLDSDHPSLPDHPNAWKFEEFIFDVLPLAKSYEVLLYPREHVFAPLKNYEGNDSIKTVQAALLALDREVYTRVTGIKPPETALFELSPSFYYPTDALVEKWKQRALPDQKYIEE
ncbi:MAG: hypothetical protein S4CHLAM2_11780 [Chlamydiales bacterium]|nr:hypothetical protein [Chlamydiales bacterium]